MESFNFFFIIASSFLIVSIISEDKHETVWEVSTVGTCVNSCGLHGQIYYWCNKPTSFDHSETWDYCSPSPGIAANNCKCTSKCGYEGQNYRWCWTADNCSDKWYYCAPVNGEVEAPKIPESQGNDPNVIVVYDPPEEISVPA